MSIYRPYRSSQEFMQAPPAGGYSNYQSPGSPGTNYGAIPPQGGTNLPAPYAPPAPASSNPLANLPLKDIKGFIDRMGGIDGIVGMMNKAQQLFANFKQFAPMFKLLAGSFLKKGSDPIDEEDYEYPKKRRRRRKSKSRRRRRSKIKNIEKSVVLSKLKTKRR